eukprot:CAMPEP_0175130098 /NCGR_PEP_ID=MMETSP0087-20121206/5827_1 /TAXON_ID=136419 /ORGANISM="Unknown Unknown, Strain D1" /LENGTH=401 /DNA_ID=CAMNT_0016412297 /DNA_START=36 /DNA_END=1241 /DNA_ORIENTATION=-
MSSGSLLAERRTSVNPPIAGRRSSVKPGLSTGRRGKTSGLTPIQQIDELKQRVALLESDNQTLKEKLTLLRKAGAAQTRVVKAPTQPVHMQERKEVKLPQLTKVDPRIAILEKQAKELTEALSKLQRDKDNMENSFIAKLDDVRGQLADKKALCASLNVDLNRLQNAGSGKTDDSGEIRRLKAMIAALEQDLREAQDVRDKTIEMGRKAEMTTVMYMKKNEDLEKKLAEALRGQARAAKDLLDVADAAENADKASRNKELNELRLKMMEMMQERIKEIEETVKKRDERKEKQHKQSMDAIEKAWKDRELQFKTMWQQRESEFFSVLENAAKSVQIKMTRTVTKKVRGSNSRDTRDSKTHGEVTGNLADHPEMMSEMQDMLKDLWKAKPSKNLSYTGKDPFN